MFPLKIDRTVNDSARNQHPVDHSVICVAQRKDDRTEHHPTQKMRQISYGLKRLFQTLIRNLVDQHGKQDRRGEIKQQT